MKNVCFFFALALLIICNGCDKKHNPDAVKLEFNFNNDTEGWAGDFADYPIGEEQFYELEFQISALPSPLDQTDSAIKHSGNNHSDDLFMFITKKITELKPDQIYNVEFDIEIGTNAAENSAGIGGSPAHSVYIKAGASQIEPVKLIDESDYYRLNIDKGQQSQGGNDMTVIGDFSNGLDEFEYALKLINNKEKIKARSNQNGELWLIIGTDSGFEGTTTIYYNNINVTLY